MTDIPLNQLLSALLFLIFPLVASLVAVRLKQSPLVGYILAGVVLKVVMGARLPAGFIESFSMLGLILLVFTIGLEANFSSMRRFGRFVILGGFLQVFLSAFFIGLVSLLFGFSPVISLFIGVSFAMSSTAVVAKILQDRGEDNSLIGGLAIGILIFQDLAFIPLFIILSSFGAGGSFSEIIISILLNVLKAGVVLLIVYILGIKAIPYLFNRFAHMSREILNLFTVVFIVSALVIFSSLGLSSLLAAFTAGVLIGQTSVHYHLFSQIRPLRDILVIVFFTFLGLTIEPIFFVAHLPLILTLSILVILVKIMVVLGIYLFFRFHSRTAFTLGLLLFQIGEAAFVILFQGFSQGVIDTDSYHIALSVVIVTLICTPAIISANSFIYARLRNLIRKHLTFVESFIKNRIDREIPNIDALKMDQHMIICGYGRVGKYVGRALMFANVPFIAVDYNIHTIEAARKEGINAIYGDPTEIDVLDYAECENAAALIAAVPDRSMQEMIILNAKKLNPKIVLFTRVHIEADQRRMKDLGVEVIVQPEFEASLSIIRRILVWRGVDKVEIANKIKRLKIEHGMV